MTGVQTCALPISGPQTSNIGTIVNVSVSAVDVDGDPLTFSASGLPVGLDINSATGVINGTIPPSEAGTHEIVLEYYEEASGAICKLLWGLKDGFAEEISQNDGLDLHTTEPLVTLLIRTENSLYRIIPLQAGDTRVLVQGGQFFPEPTEASFAGSSFGGSFLKMHWIGVGLRMEIYAAGQRIVTSQVRRIEVLRETSVTTAH